MPTVATIAVVARVVDSDLNATFAAAVLNGIALLLPQESEPYGQLLDDYTNIRDVQQAVRHRIQVTENTSFDYSLFVQNTVGHTG